MKPSLLADRLGCDRIDVVLVDADLVGDEVHALLQLDHFETVLTPVGEDSMAWNIGDEGFEMVLGNYVPHIIDDHIIGAPLSGRKAPEVAEIELVGKRGLEPLRLLGT